MLGRIQQARRKILKAKTPYRAVMGDSSGNIYAGDGLYWVRPYDSADANNIATTGAPYRVRAGIALIVPRAGRVVWIGYGLDNRLTVLGYDHDDLVQAGINPSSIQPNDPYREWIRLKDIQNFRALPISVVSGLLVQVRQLVYYTHTGDTVLWNGTNAATQIDLSAYVPGDGYQRYVVLWLRVYNPNGLSNIQVTSSTVISSINAVLSFDDLQECADQADADTIPIQAFRLANAQTLLKIDNTIDLDLRQFINMPQVFGFPNTVHRAYRVHEEFSVVAPSAINVESGGLIQIQDNALLQILSVDDDSSSSSTGGITQLTGDVTAGPGSGSQAATLANSGVSAGSYTNASVTFDAKGRATSASSGATPAPVNATYLVQTSDGTLTNEQAMGTLSTGLVKNTTTTGVQSIAVAGTDYTSPTGTENLSNKTITASSLVATALSLLIGGLKAIFSHANTADRTYTFPNYDGTLATLAGSETLTNKTITGPVISGGSINNTPIGATTPSTGAFSNAFKIFGSLGFYAQLVNSNTANRTITFPDVSITVVGNGNTATLTNKTLSSPVIIGGTVDGTIIGSTTPASGYFDALRLYIAGAFGIFSHANTADRTYTLPNYDGTLATLAGTETLSAKTLTSPKVNEILDSNGNEEIKFTTTASAVNEITVTNAATNTAPTMAATGGDSNVGLNINPKGTGTVSIDGAVTINDSGADRDFRVEGDTNANLLFTDASADAVGIGTNTPDAKTILHVVSTTRAAIPAPSMTAAQRDAITSPASGSMVYVNDQKDMGFYDSVDWRGLYRPYYSEMLNPFSGHTIVAGAALGWVSDVNQAGAGYYRRVTPALNDEASYTVALPTGTFHIEYMAVKASSFGVMSIIIDGSTVSTHDLYSAATTYNVRGSSSNFNINTPGSHTLTIKAASKNASSTNYFTGVAWFQFIKTAEYP